MSLTNMNLKHSQRRVTVFTEMTSALWLLESMSLSAPSEWQQQLLSFIWESLFYMQIAWSLETCVHDLTLCKHQLGSGQVL